MGIQGWRMRIAKTYLGNAATWTRQFTEKSVSTSK